MFGLVIMGHRQLQFLKLVFTAIGYALCTFVVRLLPFPFGVHALIHIGIVIILFLLICKLNFKRSVIAALLSMGTLLVLENTVLYAIQLISDLSLQKIWQDSILRTVVGWPHLLVWIFVTWVLYRNKVSIFNTKENISN